MSYIQNNLLSNERVVYLVRPHWIVFAMPVILLIVTIVLAIYAPLLFPGFVPFVHVRLYSLVILGCLATAIISGVSTFILYTTSEYAITDRRILIKTGWISRNSLELFLDKVEGINIDQSILGRLLSYGSLKVIGTGGTQDIFFYIPDPLRFRKTAQKEVEEDSRRNR